MTLQLMIHSITNGDLEFSQALFNLSTSSLVHSFAVNEHHESDCCVLWRLLEVILLCYSFTDAHFDSSVTTYLLL